MKKITVTILLAVYASSAIANQNVMFAPDEQNSVTLYIGQSTGKGTLFKLINPFLWKINPDTMIMAQYSQPTEIFRLPARINFNIIQNIGYKSCDDLSFIGAGISWDIALLNWRGAYLGFGVGPYYRDNLDRWVSSRLVFGEKFFIGKNLGTKWRGEFFTLHFSNGNFTKTNHGFNFFGLGLNYSF